MKKLSKLLCLALALVLALGLVACGSSNSSSASTAQSTPAPAATGSSSGSSAPAATAAPIGNVEKSETEPDTAGSHKGGTLTISCNTEVTTGLFTHDLSSWQALEMLQPVYETLFRNVDGEIQPYLATGYDSDPDAKTYTIHLRDDVYFHDGSKLNAEVVKWNLEYYRDSASRGMYYFANLESVDVIDEYTVQLNLSNWDITIIPSLTIYPGNMTSKEAWEKNGQDYLNETCPIGTGPYKFESWEYNVNKVYVRNDNYWGGEPNFDKVEIKMINDDLVVTAALQTGEIDMVMNGSPNLYGQITFDVNMREFVAFDQLQNIVFSATNPDSPFSDLRVRQAICYALDTWAFNEAFQYGSGTVTNQFGVPGDRFYNDSLTGLYDYDLEKAKSLMAEAGYADGFTCPLYYVGIPTQTDVAAAIQDALQPLNITLELHGGTVEYAEWMWYFDEGILVHMMGLPVDLAPQFVSNFKTGATGFGQNALIHTPELDAIIDGAVSARTLEEEGAGFQAANKVIIEDMALWYPFYTIPNLTFANTYLNDTGLADGIIDYLHIWRES